MAVEFSLLQFEICASMFNWFKPQRSFHTSQELTHANACRFS